MIDYLIRAESKDAWDAYAAERGWMEAAAVMDVRIDEIGPVMMSPPVFDVDGNETTPAVMDDWHHVNLRLLSPDASALPVGGVPVEVHGVRGYEIGAEPKRIQLLYSGDITSPIRVWADGMHHAPVEAFYGSV